MKIFANHAHVFPADIRPEGDIPHLLHLMDECGIEKAVAFAPFFPQWGDHESDPIHWLAKEVHAHPDRLAGYAAINPERADAIDLLRTAKDLGLQGVKMHPAFDKWNLKSEQAYRFYEKAEELSMPLDFHTGVHHYRISQYHPLLFDDIACDFPKLKLVFEHVGGYHFFQDMLAVFANHTGSGNLYAGIASVLSPQKQKYWYLGPEKIKDLLWQVGEDWLIYGLDFPYNNAEDVKNDLKQIHSLDISDSCREKLLGKNLECLLKSK